MGSSRAFGQGVQGVVKGLWTRSSDPEVIQYMQIHSVSWSAQRYMPTTKRSPKDLFLTKGCSRGKSPVTREPKRIAKVLYEPARAGCMRLLVFDKSSCSSRFAQRVIFLHVKSTVASGQKPVGALAHTSTTRLCCLEQPIAPSTRHCMVCL